MQDADFHSMQIYANKKIGFIKKEYIQAYTILRWNQQ